MSYTYMIRQAIPDDLRKILDLRQQAEAWLHGQGIRQWLPEWRERSYRLIEKNVHDGKTWIIFDGDTPAATVTLNGPDLDFWHEGDGLKSGLHFYKLIVSRSHAGTGLGEAVIDWVSKRAESEGKKWVRLDCWRDNYRLQNYYHRLGFEHVRTEAVKGRESGALFQRKAGVITGDGTIKVVQRS